MLDCKDTEHSRDTATVTQQPQNMIRSGHFRPAEACNEVHRERSDMVHIQPVPCTHMHMPRRTGHDA